MVYKHLLLAACLTTCLGAGTPKHHDDPAQFFKPANYTHDMRVARGVALGVAVGLVGMLALSVVMKKSRKILKKLYIAAVVLEAILLAAALGYAGKKHKKICTTNKRLAQLDIDTLLSNISQLRREMTTSSITQNSLNANLALNGIDYSFSQLQADPKMAQNHAQYLVHMPKQTVSTLYELVQTCQRTWDPDATGIQEILPRKPLLALLKQKGIAVDDLQLQFNTRKKEAQPKNLLFVRTHSPRNRRPRRSPASSPRSQRTE